MGLETVEILMDVEDRFGIHISDAFATACMTVADLQREVVRQLEEKGRAPSPELDREVFEGIVDVIVKNNCMKAGDVKPESRWVGDVTRYG